MLRANLSAAWPPVNVNQVHYNSYLPQKSDFWTQFFHVFLTVHTIGHLDIEATVLCSAETLCSAAWTFSLGCVYDSCVLKSVEENSFLLSWPFDPINWIGFQASRRTCWLSLHWATATTATAATATTSTFWRRHAPTTPTATHPQPTPHRTANFVFFSRSAHPSELGPVGSTTRQQRQQQLHRNLHTRATEGGCECVCEIERERVLARHQISLPHWDFGSKTRTLEVGGHQHGFFPLPPIFKPWTSATLDLLSIGLSFTLSFSLHFASAVLEYCLDLIVDIADSAAIGEIAYFARASRHLGVSTRSSPRIRKIEKIV